MRRNNKNGVLALLVLLAIGLWGFKKKEGTVEVGEGSFGEFGTDGSLDDLEDQLSKETIVSANMKASVIPNSGSSFSYDDSMLKPLQKEFVRNGCCA